MFFIVLLSCLAPLAWSNPGRKVQCCIGDPSRYIITQYEVFLFRKMVRLGLNLLKGDLEKTSGNTEIIDPLICAPTVNPKTSLKLVAMEYCGCCSWNTKY